ncbi:MAG: hypothetical protein IPJ84_09580 [Bdellovibrionales bacterium]|nr:hypothetical protein [Bdellovibrionales bacterium]
MSKRLSLMSSSDLLASLSKTALPKPDYYASTNRDLAEERTRILAELTGRKKDETALKILENEAVEGQSAGSRAVALSGLGDLPPASLRLILLQALKSEDRLLKRVAFYMALDMKEWTSDAELLKALEVADKPLLQRIQSEKLCIEEKYD